ncbi:MAG: hypothetical protein V1819_01775 [bacterium]
MGQRFENQFTDQLDAEHLEEEQPNVIINSEPNRTGVRPFWVVMLMIFTAIIVGGGVYFWQNKSSGSIISKLQGKIAYVANQVSTLIKSKEIKITVQDKEEKYPLTQTYRNEAYGFEISYPEQWGIKNTLPTTTQDTIAFQNIEFFNNSFPTSQIKFVLYANPLGFGMEYCNIDYKINGDGSKITSAIRQDDQCASEYKRSHPKPLLDRCSDGIRYACFSMPTMNNNNFYLGYLRTDPTGPNAISDIDADKLLQKILLSFRAF